MIVKRWFLKTVEGDILDGPFKSKERATRERALHRKRYKYNAVIATEKLDIAKETKRPLGGDFDEYGY